MPKKKSGTDWVLVLLVLVFAIVTIAFIVGSKMPLASLDGTVKTNPDGTWMLTFTGLSELIVAICSGIGIIIKAQK